MLEVFKQRIEFSNSTVHELGKDELIQKWHTNLRIIERDYKTSALTVTGGISSQIGSINRTGLFVLLRNAAHRDMGHLLNGQAETPRTLTIEEVDQFTDTIAFLIRTFGVNEQTARESIAQTPLIQHEINQEM